MKAIAIEMDVSKPIQVEKAFEELDYEECTEEQCIMKIQELLQVDNAIKMELVSLPSTQINGFSVI